MNRSILAIAFQGVRSHLLRTMLAVISLSIGVVGVVTMAAASATVSDSIQQKSLMAGGPSVTVEITVQAPRSLPGILTAAMHDLRGQGLDIHVSRGGTLDGLTASLDAGASAEVRFVESNLREIRPFVLVSGTWVDDTPRFQPRAVANRAAERLGGASVGASVLLSGIDRSPLRVVITGVVDDGSNAPTVFVSSNSASAWLDARGVCPEFG